MEALGLSDSVVERLLEKLSREVNLPHAIDFSSI
jgi:hypothetical protein